MVEKYATNQKIICNFVRGKLKHVKNLCGDYMISKQIFRNFKKLMHPPLYGIETTDQMSRCERYVSHRWLEFYRLVFDFHQ